MTFERIKKIFSANCVFLTLIITEISCPFFFHPEYYIKREKRKIVSNFVLESKVTFLRFIKSSVSFPYPKCQSESRVKHRRAENDIFCALKTGSYFIYYGKSWNGRKYPFTNGIFLPSDVEQFLPLGALR